MLNRLKGKTSGKPASQSSKTNPAQPPNASSSQPVKDSQTPAPNTAPQTPLNQRPGFAPSPFVQAQQTPNTPKPVQFNPEAAKVVGRPTSPETPSTSTQYPTPGILTSMKEQQSLGGNPSQLSSFLDEKRQERPVPPNTNASPAATTSDRPPVPQKPPHLMQHQTTSSSEPSPQAPSQPVSNRPLPPHLRPTPPNDRPTPPNGRPTVPPRNPQSNAFSSQPSASPTPMPSQLGTQSLQGSANHSPLTQQPSNVQAASLSSPVSRPNATPRQELQSLVGDVASGKLSGYDAIYNQYSTADNGFQTLTPEGYKQRIDGLKSPVAPAPSIKGYRTGENFIQYTLAGTDMQQRTQERVYVHAKSDHAPDVMQHLLSEQMNGQNEGVTAAKVWNYGEITKRNDGIVVYTEGGKSTQDVIQSLKGYQQNNPTHFGSSTPMMTQKHGAGIATGPDPKEGGSFGTVRADAIAQAEKNLRGASNRPIDPQRLQTEVDRLLREAGVDPRDPSTDL
ncbi:MAG: hypothetical protein H6728_01265 [Myxococcales bacterium]|nr:hypothetical protein [Myxococcales bacterium]MCB9641682.1 hypothetical protein [Myxococcales bacterium]